jgi:hypothetical protein
LIFLAEHVRSSSCRCFCLCDSILPPASFLFCRFRISGFNHSHQIWFFLPAARALGFWFPRKDSRHRVLGSDRVPVCLVSFSMQEPCPGVQRAWDLCLPAGPAVTCSKSRPSEVISRFLFCASIFSAAKFGFWLCVF